MNVLLLLLVMTLCVSGRWLTAFESNEIEDCPLRGIKSNGHLLLIGKRRFATSVALVGQRYVEFHRFTGSLEIPLQYAPLQTRRLSIYVDAGTQNLLCSLWIYI